MTDNGYMTYSPQQQRHQGSGMVNITCCINISFQKHPYEVGTIAITIIIISNLGMRK